MSQNKMLKRRRKKTRTLQKDFINQALDDVKLMIMTIMRMPISTARDSINRNALCGGIKGLKNLKNP